MRDEQDDLPGPALVLCVVFSLLAVVVLIAYGMGETEWPYWIW